MTGDNLYWSTFYANFNLQKPSDFAKFVMTFFDETKKKLSILDAGCGNGRDSYFLSSKFDILGVDLAYKPDNKLNCMFIKDNFVTYDKTKFDIIYSRFTFHSITNDDHELFLDSIKSNTYLCLETRSDIDKDSNRYHGDNHYRNFTNIDYLKNLLNKYNFKILYIKESNNFAIYKNENPICIRVICQKL